MESADLTPRSPPDEDALDTLLRQSQQTLPDDGFSARVLAAMPPARPATRVVSRQVLVGIGGVAGLAVAIARTESAAAFQSDWASTSQALTQIATTLGDPNFLTALSVAGVSVLYAFMSPALRRR